IRLVLPERVGPSSTFSDPWVRESETSAICVSPPTTLETFRNSSTGPSPLFRRSRFPAAQALHELIQRSGFLLRQFQTPLGPAPQYIFRRHRPLMIDKVTHFGFIEI